MCPALCLVISLLCRETLWALAAYLALTWVLWPCPILSELLLCALSVLPTLELTQHPMGNQVNVITCQVDSSTPETYQLTWLENGVIFWTEVTLTLIENKDGNFNWAELAPGELLCPQGGCGAHLPGGAWRAAGSHQKSYPWRSLLVRRTGHPGFVRTPLQLTQLFIMRRSTSYFIEQSRVNRYKLEL